MANKTTEELEKTLLDNKCNDRLNLIYQWVKNDIIGLKQFKHLLSVIQSQD